MLQNRLSELGESIKRSSEAESLQSTKRTFDLSRLRFENRVAPLVDWWTDTKPQTPLVRLVRVTLFIC